MPRWFKFTITGTLIVAIGLIYFAVARPIQVLPQLDPVPFVTLVDADGQSFFPPDRSERMVIYTFGATRDPATPERLRRLFTTLSDALAGEPEVLDKLEGVFITLDPAYDTPQRLKEWASSLQLESPIPLTFVTGSEMSVKLAVGTGFGVYYDSSPSHIDGPVSPVTYDPVTLLVDSSGIVRARYQSADPPIRILARDVGLVAKEEDATGATRWLYSGAHLFMCYPR